MHFTGRTWRPHYEADSVIIQATSGCTYNQCRLVSAKCTARILDRRKSICQFGVELLPGHCVSAKGAVVGARCITARHRHSERGGNDKIPQVAESARIGDDFGLVFYRKAVYNFYNKRKEDKEEKKHETLYCNCSMQSLRGLHGGIASSGYPQALLLFFT